MGINHIVFICKLIHIQKMTNLKGKFQNRLLHLFLMLLFQEMLHFPQQVHKLQRKSRNIFQHLIVVTFPFIFQQMLVTLLQNPV